MTKLEEQFGAMVRHHRKRAGLTQAQLAERTDRQPNAIQNIEQGKAGPTFETIVRLAQALEVDPRDFFGVGDFAARDGRNDPLVDIVNKLSSMSDAELKAVFSLLEAAVVFRKV
ncbi:helix-turn-helix transcriptional regulator [Caulobacter sp. CCNWLY153]|uniref:helix-turn-helix domain-containing protein n=1 Tax=unclassified Caulobacter TaxID=2648921 RepID=UPI002FF2A20B